MVSWVKVLCLVESSFHPTSSTSGCSCSSYSTSPVILTTSTRGHFDQHISGEDGLDRNMVVKQNWLETLKDLKTLILLPGYDVGPSWKLTSRNTSSLFTSSWQPRTTLLLLSYSWQSRYFTAGGTSFHIFKKFYRD